MKHSLWIRTLALCSVLLMLVGCAQSPSDDTDQSTTSATGSTSASSTASGSSTDGSTLVTDTTAGTGGTTASSSSSSSSTTTTTTTVYVPMITSPTTNNQGSLKGEINVVKKGVDNTGKTDVTDQLIALHKTGKPIYYPNGTYLFNGDKLDFSGGVRFESKNGVLIRNSISDTPIVNFDDNGNLIGLMHNHLELRYKDKDYREVGNLVSPPLSSTVINSRIDVVPYWYNDFGRQFQLVGTGWKGWYDWQWNHHDCDTIAGIEDPYDPDIHSLLGFYRGDEVEVLDWQCYWLHEYGMGQSVLLGGGWTESWNDPKNDQYWIYNLLNNTPNAKNMKFALSDMFSWGFPTNQTEQKNLFSQMVRDFYGNRPYRDMVYCYERGGKRYPVLFIWDENYLKSQCGGTAGLESMYAYLADQMKSVGYDGVCIYARMGAMESSLPTLNQRGVEWFNSAYPCNAIEEAGTYEQMVNSFNPSRVSVNTVFAVSLGQHTHDPHPSQWVHPGNTPKLFKQWLTKAFNAVKADTSRPAMITIYNVSEWHEGRAGLTPTVGQRFGYLDAIRDVIMKQ